MRVFVLKKKVLVRVLVFVLLLTGAAVYTKVAIGGDTQTFSSSGEGTAICSVDTDKKEICLTFDTAFGEDQTEAILQVLKDKGVRATFAVMGAWGQENDELLRAIREEGHDIISHSMTHERYNEMEADAIAKDAQAARSFLKLEAGTDTPFIRPPYGACSEEVYAALRKEGMIPVRWSIDSKDWNGEGAEAITKQVVSNCKPGAIVLFQNNVKDTPEALAAIIDQLKELGYSFTPLSEMAMQENYIVDINGIQRARETEDSLRSPDAKDAQTTKEGE